MQRFGVAYRAGVIWRRRYLVLGIVIFSALTSAMTMAFRHGVYQTQAVLIYPADIRLLTEMMPLDALYASVFSELKLMEQAEYNPALVNDSSVLARYVQVGRRMMVRGEGEGMIQAEALAHLRSRLRAALSGDGRMITVVAEAEEARLSPKLANQLAMEYQKKLMPLAPVEFKKATPTWVEMSEPVWPRAFMGMVLGLIIGLMAALKVEKIKRGMQNDSRANIAVV